MKTELDISTSAHGSLTVVELAGMLDLSGATRLLSELPALARTGSRVVVCDLSQLQTPAEPYLLTVFAAAQRHSGPWPHSAIHLAAPGPDLAQRLLRLGLPRFLPVHPTLTSAMVAADADVAETHSDLVMVPDASNSAAAEHALSKLWPDIEPEHEAHQDGLRVTSELTSYAGRHSSSSFTVSMALSSQRFMVSVTDDSRHELVEHPIRTHSTYGRALELMTDLSQQWGVRLVHERGKTVWAALLRHDLTKVGA
ncbi:MAG TPA: hypothetical protein VHN80_06060 [Kineosporiaceae bacterium]|nr:hypothetical protein [Kineosporiaceae bacterium]